MNERAASKRAAKENRIDETLNNSSKRTRKSGGPRTDEQNKCDVDMLKTITVCDKNMEEIKKKLIATMTYRLRMLDVNEIDLLETFPFFFTDPSLVIDHSVF